MGVLPLRLVFPLLILAPLSCQRAGFEASGESRWPDPSVERIWRQLHPRQNPGRLVRSKLVYHPGRQTVLLYGGERHLDSGELELNDELWELEGSYWRKVCGPCPPGPRDRFGMAYDQRRGLLLIFGGQDAAGFTGTEVWEWDGYASWEQRQPAGTWPSPRHSFYMTYDRAGERTLMYGGRLDDDSESNELWAYDGDAWQQIAQEGTWPDARLDDSSTPAYDPYAGWFVFYGGYGTTSHDELWAFDGSQWLELCVECTGQPRRSVGLVFDIASGRLLLFNGYGPGEIAGTWEYNGDSWERPYMDVPGQRDSMGVAYDEARERVIVYGGDGASCDDPEHCDATLEYVLDER